MTVAAPEVNADIARYVAKVFDLEQALLTLATKRNRIRIAAQRGLATADDLSLAELSVTVAKRRFKAADDVLAALRILRDEVMV